jgi:hypothetical protein
MRYTKSTMGRPWKGGTRRAPQGDRNIDTPTRRPQPHVKEPWADPFDLYMDGLRFRAERESFRIREY